MGANLYEVLGIVSYQPLPRLNLVAKTFFTTQGRDTAGTNFGTNVLYDYNTRLQDFDNRIAQGVNTRYFHGDLTATYQIKHNLWIDAKQIVRRQTSRELPSLNNTTAITSLAVRWNIAQRLHEF